MMSDKIKKDSDLYCNHNSLDRQPKNETEEDNQPCIICAILEDNKEHVDSVRDYLLDNFVKENYKEPECSRKVKDLFESEISDLSLFKKVLGQKQYEKFLDSLVFVSANPDHLVLLLSMIRNVFVPMARTYETLLTALTNTPKNNEEKL